MMSSSALAKPETATHADFHCHTHSRWVWSKTFVVELKPDLLRTGFTPNILWHSCTMSNEWSSLKQFH